MARISLCLDPAVADWVRAEAAAKKMSMSRFVARLLREERALDQAIERVLGEQILPARKPSTRRDS